MNKSILILLLLPLACIAQETDAEYELELKCQAAYESLYTSPELYPYADTETLESCMTDSDCEAAALAAGVPPECVGGL